MSAMGEAPRQNLDVSRVGRRGAFLGTIASQIRSRTAEILRGKSGTVLDVGCGNGLLFAELGAPTNLRMVGLDEDLPLLREGLGVMEDNGMSDANLVKGDAFRLPIKDKAADFVVVLNTLMNFVSNDQAERLLKVLFTVCKDDGRLIFDVRNGSNPLLRLRYAIHNLRGDFKIRSYRLRWIRRVCESNGFDLARAEPLGTWIPRAYLIEARKQGSGPGIRGRKDDPDPPILNPNPIT